MLFDQFSCLGITFLNDALDFAINGRCNLLTIASGMCQVPADKNFILIIIVVDRSDFCGETILGDHILGCLGRLLDIRRCPCRDVVKNDLLRHTTAQRNDDIL